MSHPSITGMLDRIKLTINKDITHQKTSLGLRNQRCYAVQSGFHGLLDVARQTYKEANDDVHELVTNYAGFHFI